MSKKYVEVDLIILTDSKKIPPKLGQSPYILSLT